MEPRFLGWRKSDQKFLLVLIWIFTIGLMVRSLLGPAGQPWMDYDQASWKLPPEELRFEVDLNFADWPELMLLPRIGATLAKRIVRARSERGGFQAVEDFQSVRGIGPKTLDAARPYLTLRPATGLSSSQ